MVGGQSARLRMSRPGPHLPWVPRGHMIVPHSVTASSSLGGWRSLHFMGIQKDKARTKVKQCPARSEHVSGDTLFPGPFAGHVLGTRLHAESSARTRVRKAWPQGTKMKGALALRVRQVQGRHRTALKTSALWNSAPRRHPCCAPASALRKNDSSDLLTARVLWTCCWIWDFVFLLSSSG